jgi:hypothetical protein
MIIRNSGPHVSLQTDISEDENVAVVAAMRTMGPPAIHRSSLLCRRYGIN